MSEIQGFAGRIFSLRKAAGSSQEEVGAALGLTKSAVSSFEKSKSVPSPENLVRLARLFRVSVDYLLTGQHSIAEKEEARPSESDAPQKIFLPKNFPLPDVNTGTPGFVVKFSPPRKSIRFRESVLVNKQGISVIHKHIIKSSVNNEGPENISLVSVHSSTEYARQGAFEPKFINSLPTFSLPDKAFKDGFFRCFVVQDDSMKPTFNPGDWVIARPLDNWSTDIRDTLVHVVVTREQVLVKRVLNQLTERDELALLSDNPAFAARSQNPNEVSEVWLVVGKISCHFEKPRYDVTQELRRTRADVDELLGFMMEIKGLQEQRVTSEKKN